jgi:aromatic-amino-acid transaminase
MQASFFSDIPLIQADPILGITEAFRNDPHPDKVNLGVGIYQDGNGKIPILESIKKATALWTSQEDTKAYLPIEGVPAYNKATQELIFGKDSAVLKEQRIATVQSVGGSGGLKIGIEFLRKFFPKSEMYISDPSWENHRLVFETAGATVHTYPYYDPATKGLRTADMLDGLRKIPERSAVLLHACCHNPTGVDLDLATWKEVVEICSERSLIPFIDAAYQGFADGLSADAAPIRLFAEKGLTFIVTNSFAKSCSLYRERCGTISVVTGSASETTNVLSQLKRIVRTIYSSPPSHGAQVIALTLTTPELRTLWEKELEEMRLRIQSMRELFTRRLAEVIPDRDFSFIKKQRGMFSYSGLSREVVVELREKFHIYALESGRICVAAMNTKNMDYICSSLATVLKSRG